MPELRLLPSVCLLLVGASACAPSVATAPRSGSRDARGNAVGITTTLAAKLDAPPPEHVEAEPLPTSCEDESRVKDAKLCVLSKAYARKLCAGIYPDLALAMFAGDAPWTRVWLAGDVDAWNASGGLTHRAKLAFDEEVVILAKHGAASAGGIVMTGATPSYDVLRFDGSCVSVMEGELTTRRPPAPKPATIAWSRLEEPTRHALLESPKVKASRDAFEKACSTGDKKACEKAERALTMAVVGHVRSGATLPTASRRP